MEKVSTCNVQDMLEQTTNFAKLFITRDMHERSKLYAQKVESVAGFDAEQAFFSFYNKKWEHNYDEVDISFIPGHNVQMKIFMEMKNIKKSLYPVSNHINIAEHYRNTTHWLFGRVEYFEEVEHIPQIGSVVGFVEFFNRFIPKDYILEHEFQLRGFPENVRYISRKIVENYEKD